MTVPWLLEQACCAGLAALGFAVLFNVPARCLSTCALSGAAGVIVRTSASQAFGLSGELSALCAATLVSLLALCWGKRLHAPALLFVIPGVIPLLPGSLAFRTMLQVMGLSAHHGSEASDLAASIATNVITVSLSILALAWGVALPGLILRHKGPMI